MVSIPGDAQRTGLPGAGRGSGSRAKTPPVSVRIKDSVCVCKALPLNFPSSVLPKCFSGYCE